VGRSQGLCSLKDRSCARCQAARTHCLRQESMSRVCCDEFVKVVSPALAGGDADGLCRAVAERWTPPELCPLLGSTRVDVRRAAALTLGLVGGAEVVGCLARSLTDADDQVYREAENALWSIWFRGGAAEAVEHFHAGVQAIAENRYSEALTLLRKATDTDPEFSEAHNQTGIVHYLRGEWACCNDACRRALALTPTHFGALASLGHGYAHLGEYAKAIASYERALLVNPRMQELREACCSLRRRVADTPR